MPIYPQGGAGTRPSRGQLGRQSVARRPVLAAITRVGSQLRLNGQPQRFAGANAYELGLTDNDGVRYLTKTEITNSLQGAREMGVNLIRAHTVGMSAGLSLSFETAAGVFNHANLDAADWAVAEAKRLGIYFIVPLTDQWNYYHGGKGVFVHWAYQQNSSGITPLPYPGNLFNAGQGKGASEENQFFATTAGGLRIRALFKEYIAAWAGHLNPYTGLRYGDDPTIAIVETGNELFSATAEWTQDIASYVKSLAPTKLLADGSAASGLTVANQPGLNAPAIDILGSHYYAQNGAPNWEQIGFAAKPSRFGSTTSFLDQLALDVSAAQSAGKAFLAGEYPWTRSDVAQWYAAVESNTAIVGDLFWSIIAGSLTHGGAFGSDDFPVHRPYSSALEMQNAPALARHISAITGIPTTNGAGTDPLPSNLIPAQAVRDADSIAPWQGGGGVLTRDTTVSRTGGSSLRNEGQSGGSYFYWNPVTSYSGALAPVTAGQSYLSSAYFRSSVADKGVHVRVLWFNASNNVVSTVDGAYTAVATDGWTLAYVQATAPAGAVSAGIQFQADNPLNPGEYIWIDDLSIMSPVSLDLGPALSKVGSPTAVSGKFGRGLNSSSGYLLGGAGIASLTTFTFEMWVNYTSPAQSTMQYAFDAGASGGALFNMGITSSGKGFYRVSTFLYDYDSLTLDFGWHHFALTLTGGRTRFFIDGVQRNTVTGSNGTTNWPSFTIGADQSGARPMVGLIDEIRLSNITRYGVEGFTPSTTPFEVDANTVVLYHFELL
jgi:hypothetical protein